MADTTTDGLTFVPGLTGKVMVACGPCEPEMHECPGMAAAPGLAVTHWNMHGADRHSVTHVRTGRLVMDACCLRGAWEAARRLGHPREFRWTSQQDTLRNKRDAVARFVLDAAGVRMFDRYECSVCAWEEV